jgi:hypothetical protein
MKWRTISFLKLALFVTNARSPSKFFLSKLEIRLSLISIKCTYGPWIPQMALMPTIRITWSRHLHYSRAKIGLNSGGVYRLEERVAYRTSVLFFVFKKS